MKHGVIVWVMYSFFISNYCQAIVLKVANVFKVLGFKSCLAVA